MGARGSTASPNPFPCATSCCGCLGCGIYVFEFKLNGTAEEALAQIKEKGYHEKYLRRGKKVTLIGVAFDAGMRNLSDRRIEVVSN